MAKRFIDTELFNDSWFMDLSIEAKVLWIYCLTNCDHAGVIEWNKRLIQFQTGVSDLGTLTEELAKSLVTVSEHLKFIPKFFEYQYPNYPAKRWAAANGAVKILYKHNLLDKINLRLPKDLPKSLGNGKGIGKGLKGGLGGKVEKDDIDFTPLPKGSPMPDSLKKYAKK